MQRGLDHDEHQFIASGELLADKFLIPYKDYPYFHMPYLSFIYAVIFKYTDHILLAARMFSVVCALISLLLIFHIAFNLFHRHHYLLRFIIAAFSVIFFMTNPLFVFTSGLAWNHDASVLFALLAFSFHCYGIRQGGVEKWMFLSGLFLGFAIGTRLSFAPVIVPFLLAIFLDHTIVIIPQKKLKMFLSFSLGSFLSMLPALLIFTLAPKQFIFGNIGYADLNMLYRQIEGLRKAITPAGKLLYFIGVIRKPGNLIVFLAFIFFVFFGGIIKNRKNENYFEGLFVIILVPFLLIGSFAPTPLWYQYFCPPIPFLVLGILYGGAYFHDRDKELT